MSKKKLEENSLTLLEAAELALEELEEFIYDQYQENIDGQLDEALEMIEPIKKAIEREKQGTKDN